MHAPVKRLLLILSLVLVVAGTLASAGQPQRLLSCEDGLNFQVPPLALPSYYEKENRRGFDRLIFGVGVPYLSATQQKKHEVFILNGLIVDAKGRPVSTGGMFVLTKSGALIIKSDRFRYHHSSLARREDVWMAGHIVIKDGVIKILNYSSGHYRPTWAHYAEFVILLSKNGVEFSTSAVNEPEREKILQMYNFKVPMNESTTP